MPGDVLSDAVAGVAVVPGKDGFRDSAEVDPVLENDATNPVIKELSLEIEGDAVLVGPLNGFVDVCPVFGLPEDELENDP